MNQVARTNGYLPIDDYAIIGNCHTAALVGRDGSIDWYCPDRFDGPAVFLRLLDARKGGCFQVAPVGPFSATRQYDGDTNVLQTTFRAAESTLRVTDFLAVYPRHPEQGNHHQGYDVGTERRLLRLVEGVQGEVDVQVRFWPTFDYARRPAEMANVDGQGVLARAGRKHLTLAAPGMSFTLDESGAAVATIRLKAGERRWLVVTGTDTQAAAKQALACNPGDCEQQLRQTLSLWRKWAGTCRYQGPYRAQVVRSALILKLLTYEPTGAVVAAPTTSLPENPGGVRNWDYRYTWLRDSGLILSALGTLGHLDEACDFLEWLHRAIRPHAHSGLQTMYTLDGGRSLPEHELKHLSGYQNSAPVRTGNGAAHQRQLDNPGEVMRAAHVYYTHLARRRGLTGRDAALHSAAAAWPTLRALADYAAEHWREPDNGIWEVRGGRADFLYSKLMCWSALDLALDLAQQRRLPGPLERWQNERDAIRHAILTRGYDEKRGAFTQSFGSTSLDATALAIPRVGFLASTDPRVQSTVQAIKQELTHEGLVYRYRSEDGLPGGEATFSLCTFWLVDALSMGGQQDEAQALFERVLSYGNDVGLFAEEIDPSTHAQLGNFPQGFSHMALIGAATNLARTERHGPETKATNESERLVKARDAAAADT